MLRILDAKLVNLGNVGPRFWSNKSTVTVASLSFKGVFHWQFISSIWVLLRYICVSRSKRWTKERDSSQSSLKIWKPFWNSFYLRHYFFLCICSCGSLLWSGGGKDFKEGKMSWLPWENCFPHQSQVSSQMHECNRNIQYYNFAAACILVLSTFKWSVTITIKAEPLGFIQLSHCFFPVSSWNWLISECRNVWAWLPCSTSGLQCGRVDCEKHVFQIKRPLIADGWALWWN